MTFGVTSLSSSKQAILEAYCGVGPLISLGGSGWVIMLAGKAWPSGASFYPTLSRWCSWQLPTGWKTFHLALPSFPRRGCWFSGSLLNSKRAAAACHEAGVGGVRRKDCQTLCWEARVKLP